MYLSQTYTDLLHLLGITIELFYKLLYLNILLMTASGKGTYSLGEYLSELISYNDFFWTTYF